MHSLGSSKVTAHGLLKMGDYLLRLAIKRKGPAEISVSGGEIGFRSMARSNPQLRPQCDAA